MIQGLYWMIWLTGPIWWLVAAAGYFAVSVLLGQLAPVLILAAVLQDRTAGRRNAQRLDLQGSPKATGLSIEGVYRMKMSDETVKANAMLAGLGGTRRVILGDTLLDGFSTEEIEVIFAHEIGHHVHKHLRQMLIYGVIFSLAGFFLADRLLALWVGSIEGAVDYANLPVLHLAIHDIGPSRSSRWLLNHYRTGSADSLKYRSDTYALKSTGLKAAYRSAFTKLARLK